MSKYEEYEEEDEEAELLRCLCEFRQLAPVFEVYLLAVFISKVTGMSLEDSVRVALNLHKAVRGRLPEF